MPAGWSGREAANRTGTDRSRRTELNERFAGERRRKPRKRGTNRRKYIFLVMIGLTICSSIPT